MQGKVFWALASIGLYGLILAGSAQIQAGATWLYGALYALFGACLLGSVARFRISGSPRRWRPLMLAVGAMLAAGDVSVIGGWPPGQRLEYWITALLGLLVVAVLVRLMPGWINRWWLGLDRRARDRVV